MNPTEIFRSLAFGPSISLNLVPNRSRPYPFSSTIGWEEIMAAMPWARYMVASVAMKGCMSK